MTELAEMTHAATPETDALKAFEARLIGRSAPFEIARQPDGRRHFVGGPDSLADTYRRAARYGDRPLLKAAGKVHNYTDILAGAEAIKARLLANQWAGQQIALALPGGAEWAQWFVAITASGGICVLVPHGSAQETEACLTQAACTAIVSAEPDAGPLPNLYVDLPDDGTHDDTPVIGGQTDALITFSSGSTGMPKGIIHTHRSLLSAQRNMLLAGMLSSQMSPARPTSERTPALPATLLMAPLPYVAGYSALLLAMATGGCVILAEADAQAIADQVAQHAVQTIVGASVDVLRQLVRLPGTSEALRSLRRLHVFGAAVQRALIDEVAAILPDVQLMTGYGLSETGGAIAAAPVTVVASQSGLCGRCLPSAEVRVLAADGTVLAVGEVGRLQVRGDMLMRAYLDPQRSAARLSKDGWFDTGDIGRIDADGWLTVKDRAEGQLLGLPTTLFRSEIEAIARARFGIDDIAIDWSDTVLSAYICGRADNLDSDRLTTGLRDLTGAADIRIVAVDALPRTASGKVDRSRLE